MKKYEYEYELDGKTFTGTAYGGDGDEVEDDILANNPNAQNIDVWRIA